MVLHFSLYLKSRASFFKKKKSVLGQILRKSRATPAPTALAGSFYYLMFKYIYILNLDFAEMPRVWLLVSCITGAEMENLWLLLTGKSTLKIEVQKPVEI